jgi:hypothetical protein
MKRYLLGNSGEDCNGPTFPPHRHRERPGASQLFTSIAFSAINSTRSNLVEVAEKKEVALMRRRFLVLPVALMIAAMLALAGGPAWGDTADGGHGGLPTTKDECKNGGWETFTGFQGQTIFKNQGDCVSFVATGGKNQPAG